MNKIFAIIIFCLTVLFICCWATIDRFKKNNSIEEITYTIKQTYNLYTDDKLEVTVYSSKADALIYYAKEAEAYLINRKGTDTCKVKVIESKITDNILYQEEMLYVFSLVIDLKVSELVFLDAMLELHYESEIIRLTIGDIYCCKKLGEPLPGVRELYGLAFEKPFLSLGAIYLKYKNTSNEKQTFNSISLLSEHDIYLFNNVNINEETNSINDIIDYDYHYQQEFVGFTVNPNQEVVLLLGITYEKELVLNQTPIIFSINEKKYYLDNFIYIKTNNLEALESLLYRGYINDFQG